MSDKEIEKYNDDYIEAYYEAEYNTKKLKQQMNDNIMKQSKLKDLEHSDTLSNIDDTLNIEVAKKKKGRPKKYDDVKQAYNDNKYYSQYYREHKHIKVECPYCKKQVIKYIIRKHQNSQKCQQMRIKQETNDEFSNKYERLRRMLLDALELHK